MVPYRRLLQSSLFVPLGHQLHSTSSKGKKPHPYGKENISIINRYTKYGIILAFTGSLSPAPWVGGIIGRE